MTGWPLIGLMAATGLLIGGIATVVAELTHIPWED